MDRKVIAKASLAISKVEHGESIDNEECLAAIEMLEIIMLFASNLEMKMLFGWAAQKKYAFENFARARGILTS